MLFPLQSLRSDTSISFENGSLGNYFRENEVTSTHVKIEVQLSSPELSMIEKGPKQKYVDIRPIPFHNDDLINYHLDNTGKNVVALQPTSRIYYVVYPILESNPSTPFNLLVHSTKHITVGIFHLKMILASSLEKT